ncbi:undecaprenyl/decaprenyl-phosphate alpha-N-acetylglucosaminyl 1-phosphate transferase [Flavobacteriaceae bacterium]|nr:undecaprenyl/decaprenyl-phosphate alpha-N-acetylglucosaminyl 1-phosphate transferase [Flavobacteriaceae bacterium]
MKIELILFLIGFGLSIVLNSLYSNWFLKIKKLDQINHRSSHKVDATKTGGLALFSVVFLITFFLYFQNNELFDFSLLLPLGIIFIIGVYDDFYNADFKLKFFIQIIVAKLLIDQGFIITNFHGFLGLEQVTYLISQLTTVFVFLILVNAINFVDGIDGLAISLFIMIITVFSVLAEERTELFYLNYLCIVSLLPLYYFNFKKNKKVFLGDAGSLFLGVLIAINTFLFLSNETYQKAYNYNSTIMSITILFYPLADLLRVFIIRIKQKKSPFKPDNQHLHHLLLYVYKNKHLSALTFIIVLNILLITLIILIELNSKSIYGILILLSLSILIILKKK